MSENLFEAQVNSTVPAVGGQPLEMGATQTEPCSDWAKDTGQSSTAIKNTVVIDFTTGIRTIVNHAVKVP